MKIALVQTDLVWQDQEKNRVRISDLIGNDSSGADVYVLPEMFSTGFTMEPEKHSEPHMGKSFRLMQRLAKEKNAAITGSLSVAENGYYYNRLYWVFPDGSHMQYDKRHLFSMGRENDHYKAGDKKLLVEFRGWKICPLICYDLRFPVWSRNRLNSGKYDYDLLIYVANWPSVRSYAWDHLLVARAIENQCFVAGVNRTGADGNGVEHPGSSALIDFKGNYRMRPLAENGVFSMYVDLSDLEAFRLQFPVLRDSDNFGFI